MYFSRRYGGGVNLSIVASVIANKIGIKIRQGKGWQADVVNNVIYYPKGIYLTESDLGFIIHEAGHLRFGFIDKRRFEKFTEMLQTMGKSYEQLYALLNAIEDIRVENKLIELYPGSKKYLEGNNFDAYYSHINTYQDVYWRDRGEYDNFLYENRYSQFCIYWILRMTLPKYASTRFLNECCHTETKQAIRESTEVVLESFRKKKIVTMVDSINLFTQLYPFYEPLLEDVKEDEKQQEENKGEKGEQEKEGGKSPLEQFLEMLKDFSKKEDEEDEGGEKSEKEESGGESGDESEDESESEKNEGEGEDEKESNEDGEGEKEESSKKPKSKKGGNKEESDEDQEKGESSGGGGGSKKEEQESDEENESSDAQAGGSGGGSSQPINIQRSVFDKRELKEPRKMDWNFKKYDRSQIDKIFDWHYKGDEEGLKKQVEQMLPQTRKAVSLLKDFEANRYEGNYRSGKLQSRKLYRLKAGYTNIFTRKVAHVLDNKDMAITLLIDESGSMSGQKSWNATVACTLLAKALEMAGRPVQVWGFNARLVQHKAWHERVSYNRMIEANTNSQGSYAGDNNDGYAVWRMAEDMKNRTETNKVLIVLSDGQPAPSWGVRIPEGDKVYEDFDLKDEVMKASKGMTVYGIGLNDTSVRKYYPKNFIVHKIEELPGLLLSFFKEYAGKKRSR
jgi:cobalamin biosynthesis protein CobT